MDEIGEKPPRKTFLINKMRPGKTFFTWKGALVTLSFVAMKSEVKVPFHELDTWLTDKWIPQNQIMTFGHDYSYEDSFSGPPTIIMCASKIYFMFEVIDMKSIWRDWIILKFIKDLEQDFPDTKLIGLKVTEIK